ncbi:MAG TPA: LPS export ABC transporter periplasmic protein LptC [Microscillaceae bacterium]|nr:LPS export ABC transporter periplasmic protein LptC [Microscillaceae bacterium]
MKHSLIIIFVLLLATVACEQKKKDKIVSKYKGPLIEVINVNAFYSDSGKAKINIKAPVQQEYENGDRTFPKGLRLDFFDQQLRNNGRLVADSAFFSKKSKLWTARGNVVVTNLLEQKNLKSDILHWNPTLKIFYTEAPVKITSPKDDLKGKGIKAHQDLAWYKMGKPKGIITVKK